MPDSVAARLVEEAEIMIFTKAFTTIVAFLAFGATQAQEPNSQLFQQILTKVSKEGVVRLIIMLKQPTSGENAPASTDTEDERQRKIKYVQRQFEQQLAPYRVSTQENETARESRKIHMYSYTPSLVLGVTREELLAIQRMEIVESIREEEFLRFQLNQPRLLK